MREYQQLRLLQLLLILGMLCAAVQSFVNAPKIISKDGNLVFESGRNRNISFRLNGNSRLLVNGEYDVLNLLMPINGNKKRPGSGAKDEWTGPEDIVDIRQLADQLAEFKESSSGADVALRQLQNRTRALRVQQRRLQIQLRQVESTAQRLKTRLELDSCQSNPCENGGTCVNTFNGYRCQCRSAFEGSKCERDVNECALFEGTDLGCQNGGQCVNQFGSFSCLCSTGWHGMHCTQRKTDCGAASSWELCGHGSCVQSSDELGYRCICDPGWKSNGIAPTCTEDVDECSAAAHTPCSTKCINLPGSFTCAPCAPGLTGNGVSCRDINECENNNGGCSLSPRVDCINSYGSSHCGPCPIGWLGDGRTCERSPLAPGSNPNAVGLTSCAQRSSVCHPLAICSEISNTIVCSCPAGMLGSGYGENGCVRGTNNNCNDMPCRNGGICVDNGPSNYTCTCLSGFGGRHCDPLPSVCSSNPCKNNGRCRSTPSDNGNGFVCQCQPGYRGRLCETRFSSCNAMLYGLTGRLRYPPGNGSYEHNAQCAWVIRTNESLVLNVTFQSFNLEDSSECRFDWLQINDGRSAAAQIIGRYCGNRLPHGGNLISSGNQLYLWFRSDNSTAYEGFDLTWQSMEPQCGGRYEFDTHGTLASPGSPGNYPRNRDCSWHLVAPNDKRIKLTFFSLQLEQHDTCNFDYVSITDAIGGRELHKFCTSEQPAPLLLPTHEAIVRFHSDNTSSDLGFQLHYSAEQRLPGCGGVYTIKEGRIVSPTLPVDNPQAISCDYEIRLAMDETIRIEFNQFELATDDCIEIYDLLEPTDAEPARNWLQSKHCGGGGGGAAEGDVAPLPPSITSRGNRVRIRYYASITSAASNHFQLIYRTDCSHTYNAISGNFTSPGYPNLTHIDGLCSYKIHTAPGTVIQLRSMDFNLHTGPDVDGDGDGGDGGDGYRNDDSSEEDSDEATQVRYLIHARHRLLNPVVNPPPTCNPDDNRVTINDGINHNVLGPFCGARKPAELYVSKTNMLTIQLSTGSGDGILGRGFHFQYTTVQAPTAACGGVHTVEGQNIRVPVTGNGHYEEDMKCTWVIMAPPGKFIMLHWISFNMEDRDCRFDFVEIYDELPSGGGSNPLKTYCGTELPQDMVTQSRMITVKFQSDFSESGDGFELAYRFMDRNECGGNLFGVTGMVMSPGYPLRYAGNLDCVWILNVPQSERLEVQRELFQLHATQNCSGDWVEVRNGGSRESPLLGRFCGDNMPRRIPSFTNQLYIHFHTDSVGTGRGFRFAWRVFASGCGGRMIGNAGVITSPNYPQPYPHDMHCEWQLRAPLGSNLQIQLEDLDLEDSNCFYDYLQLEPIQSNVDVSKSSRSICMLPPKPENRILDMGSSLARIIFHSDVSEANKGFRLSYRAICDRELLDMHGIIESINYGESWYDQEILNCSWRIRGPRGNHVLLEFSHFDQRHQQLVPTADDGGGVYVMEEGNPTSRKLTTRIVGLGVYNSSSDFVTIIHNSSSINFRMEYRIEGCLHEMREESGTFHSLNYPNVYPNDVECLWLIHASEGHVIELTVTEMDIEESINCTKDALVISNSNTQGINPQERHCGSKGMQIFTSAGPKFYVHFKTDGSHNGRGFEANYRIVKSKCGGKLLGTKGTIESPGYPQLYPPKTECEWIIEVSPHHTIIFELEDMDIESAFECIWDHVTVYDLSASDGITDTSDNVDDTEISQIFRLCGSSLESSINHNQSTTNRALVRFMTDDSNQRRGFRLHYHESCGQTQSIDETDYQYIMLQRQVPSNESCVWVLRANDPGKHIIFTPTHVQLYPQESARYPSEGDCMAHGVKIYEGVTATGTPRLQFCRSHPPALISVGAALTISVPLSLIADFEGHFMTMDVMCGSTYDALSGRFTSPYYPSSYPVNIECVWVIEATAGNSISLTLESFDMEESDGCNNDYLEIREDSERGPLIGVYCGKQVPPAVHSKGNIWMKFKSNDDVVGEGFMASYNYELHNELNGTEGEVTSPRYPSNFLSPVPYTWRITVDPDYVVLVNVDHLRDVDREYVSFYDGYTDIGSVMQPRSEQPSLISNTNVLYMKATRGPFKLSWMRLAKTALADNRTAELQLRLCGQQMVRIDRSVIIFKSPGYPGGYETDLNCSWIFMSNNPAMHASLQLTTVDLEQFGDDCYTDYLKVSSSNNMEHWTELAKLCRTLNESQTYQGTPYLRLQFITDTSVNKTGFSSILRSVCGSELTASQGIVNITEMGPQRYLSSPDCVWTIRVRQGRRIRITFLESQLNSRRSPNNGDCPTFFVVRNGFADDSPFLGHGKYCENNITDVLETTSNRAYIKFHRRNILDYRAAFRYEEISNACSNHIVLPDPLLAGSYNLSEPVISSPNYPNLPNPHSECVWRISAPLEHRIALEFFGDFNLSPASDIGKATEDKEMACNDEFVQVNDGSTELSPQLGRFCGVTKPDTILSSGSEMRVKFYTGVLEPHLGFQARLRLANCGRSYYSRKGVIKSPRPEELQSHLHTKYNGVKQCAYTIEVERGSTIELHFESMNLGVIPYCNQSTYLLLDEMDPFKEDEKPTDSLVVCGRSQRKFLVETNKVIVRLMMPSGHLRDDERFELHYQAIGSRCGETINAADGYLQTPNYPRGVQETTHCVWRVQVPKGMRVRVQIVDFDNGSPSNRTSASFAGPFFGRLAFFNDFKLQSAIGRYRLNAPTYVYSSDNRISIDAFLFPQGQHRGFKVRFTAYGTSLCHAFEGGEHNRLEFRWPSVGDNSTPYCNYALNPPEHHTLVLQVQFNRSNDYETMAQCRKTRPLQLNRPEESEQLLPYLLCTEDSQKNHTLRLPFPLEMIVSIQSRIGSMYLGLSYTLQQCGGMVPLEPGDNLNITRPTQLSSALQAIDCAWAVGPDTTVEDPLSAEDVQLEITISVQLLGDCERHYVNVYAGPDQNSPLVGHYCQGASETNKVVERGLFMEYHADLGIDPANNSTFNVTVRYGSGCGGRLTYPYRVIDFRDQYRNNVECVWDVEAEDGFHIGLTFISRFYIEDSPDCSKDYLLIQQLNETSGNYTDLQKICGRSPPEYINTTSTGMRLIFRSDGNVNGEGFTANFERNCGGTLYATSDAQILSSPNYPRGYGRNLYCNYTFVPLEPYASGVRVAFLTFDLERSPMRVCMYDNVTITTRDSPDNIQESVICGVKLRHVYRAKESISLVLQTDSTFSGSGFQLEYSTRLCGGVVSATQMIESPRQHQDDQMPHNSDCYWNLTAPAGKKFTLKFELIDFESASTCMYDGVEIFSSPVPDAHRRMARFCGRLTGLLPTLHIPDNRALIHSFSDERDASRGFRVLVRVLDNCDQTIVLGEQNSSYTFSKFVGQYANNLDCGFVFKAPAGYQLNVEFRSFHVQASTGCTADYLQFSDGAGPFGDDIGRFCGQDLPSKLSSSRHSLFMRFVSDAAITDTGFELLVTATRQPCGNPLIKLDGTEAYELRSPANEQGNYDSNLFCTWKIESDNNLHLQFLSLDLEGPDANGSCTADYLKMYDSESQQLLEQGYGDEVIFNGKVTHMFSGYSSEYVYCGKGQPEDYYPNSREVYVKFHSNEAVTAKGFRLRVVPDSSCRHVYGGLQGRVKFAGTADCDVFIRVPVNYTLSLYFGDVTFGSYDCDDEHVTIYERATNKSLKRVCSYMDASKSFFAQTNDLRLHFKTNSYFTEFDMTYIASSLTAGIGCGGDLYNTQGLFTNAFYPESRRNNSDCRWNIRVPSNTRVLLNFEVFNLGSRATCHTDYLQILETNSAGESQEMRRFCGNDIPHNYQSQRSQLTVRYKKSVNYDGIGWVIKFSGVSNN